MFISTTKIPENFYEYLTTFFNNYVELYTYFSLSPLYGEVIKVTPSLIVLDSKYLGTLNLTFNESAIFYLPINSIISIRLL